MIYTIIGTMQANFQRQTPILIEIMYAYFAGDSCQGELYGWSEFAIWGSTSVGVAHS